jgi:hypothetical protein
MNWMTNWVRLNLDLMSLGVEASEVMTLRLLKLAAGGAAATAEAERMVSEKLQAAAEVQADAFAAALKGEHRRTPRRALAHYRKKVRANRRRLSRK